MAFRSLVHEAALINYLERTGRCAVEILGESVQGRPVRMLRMGWPSAPDAEFRPAACLVGMQHGLEPAGREGILDWAQVLAGPRLQTLATTSGDYASTPNSAELSITGDLDIRADVEMSTWEPSAITYIVAKYDTSTDDRSYALRVDPGGRINLIWSTDGSTFINHDSTETVLDRLPAHLQRLAIRATLDVDNDAGGHTLTFYTAPTIDGPWEQLGDPVVDSGTTSIYDSAADLTVNGHTSGTAGTFDGYVFAVQIYDGIISDGGSSVCEARFQEQDPGATSFIDTAGNTWTVHGSATLAYLPTSTQQTMLTDHGVALIPSVNPDGFAATERYNANGEDLNRDWIALTQPESRAVSARIGQLRPLTLLDAHEFVGPNTPDDVRSNRGWPLSMSTLVLQQSEDLRDVVAARMTNEGYTYDHWGASNRQDRVVLDINSQLRYIPSIIIETNRLGGRSDTFRTTMYYQAIDEILEFAGVNAAQLITDIDQAIQDQIAVGAAGEEPFRLTLAPIYLDPPPLAYRMVGVVPQLQLDVFGIDVSPGLIVRMDQAAYPLIPFIFDTQSPAQVSQGTRLYQLPTINTAPTVADFAPVASGSHRVVVQAWALSRYQTGIDPTGVEIPILGGDVAYDATAGVFATLDLVTTGVDVDGRPWFPRSARDQLAPFGHEVFVRRGVDLGDTVLWSPLGYFRIDEDEQDDASDDPIRITGQDRMGPLVDHGLLDPIQFGPRAQIGTVVEQLVHPIYPHAAVWFDDDSASQTLGRQLVVEKSRYQGLLDVVESLGKVIYWTGDGILRIEDEPPGDQIAWEVRAGQGGVLISSGRRVSVADLYNAVAAEGEGTTQEPVRAVAVDTGRSSPTRWHPPADPDELWFGQRPYHYQSQLLTSNEQAFRAARAQLIRRLGMRYSADFTVLANPALRPRQVVRVTQKDGNRELHRVQALRIPLTGDAPMTGTTREQTRASVGSLA